MPMPRHARPEGLTFKRKNIRCCERCEAEAEARTLAVRSIWWEAVDTRGVAHVCSKGQKDPMLCGEQPNGGWWWAV